jgi:hypothetical protein
MKRFLALVIILLSVLPFAVAQEGTYENLTLTEGVSSTEGVPSKEGEQEPVTDAPAVNEPLENSVDEAITEIIADDVHPFGFAARLGIALGIIAGSALLIWLVWQLFKLLALKVNKTAGDKIKPLTIKKLKLLSAKQIMEIILFGI